MTETVACLSPRMQARMEQQVRGRVESLSYLPTTAAVAMKFVQLGQNPEADPAAYARVVSADASLCSKLLGLANSSWFGVRNKVVKPQVAVSLLGLPTVRTLAISYCLTGLHSDLQLTAQESQMFWSTSLCKAVAAKHVAAATDVKLAEEAFTVALFQDFALPVMYAINKEGMLPLLQDPHLDIAGKLQKERDLFRLDHAEVGRLVAQKLELPDVLVDGVAFHHHLSNLRDLVGRQNLADAVYVSSLLPHVPDAWNTQDIASLRQFLAGQSADPAAELRRFLKGVQTDFDDICRYFQAEAGPGLNLVALMDQMTHRAAQEAAEAAAQAAQEAERRQRFGRTG